jgi:hypothetical protein
MDEWVGDQTRSTTPPIATQLIIDPFTLNRFLNLLYPPHYGSKLYSHLSQPKR